MYPISNIEAGGGGGGGAPLRIQLRVHQFERKFFS